MNKKRAKFNFILTIFLVVIAFTLCFAQFKIPGSTDRFMGMFNSISTTGDISYGNSATYEITSENVKSEDVKNTVVKIREILDDQGFVSSKVYSQGAYIKAEIEGKSNAANILSILGNSKTFFISSTDKTDGELLEKDLGKNDIVGTDIIDAFSTTQFNLDTEYNGVTIKFNEKGSEKLKELTKEVSAKNKTVYFYINGIKSTSLEVEESSSEELSFYSSSYTKETAQEYALQILMSSTGVNLKTISNSTVSPTLGNNVLLYCMIACTILIACVLALLPVIFGHLGLVADLAILVAIPLNIFFLQALPLTTGSLTTIFGTMLGLGLSIVCHVLYLNKMKSEFKSLNKLQLSARTGFKKSWPVILDLTAVSFIGSVILALWNLPFVSTFAIGLAIGSFVALLCNVVVLKDFITWYVNINKKDYKKVKFTKGENND